jgi:deoxyribodipyrimidine photolyase-like uncharacterized protein
MKYPADRARDAQNVLSQFTNDTIADDDAFIEAIKRDHRTLQQSQVRLALKIIEAFAEIPERLTDARNEGAVKTSKEVIKLFKEKNDGIPPSKYLGHI